MSFLETVERARALLERHRRVSFRALRLEFDLDSETLVDLTEELVQVQHVAVQMRGRLAAALGDVPASDRALRQALDLYRAIGATGHAERLAREIAS